ncbi:MAG: hypothetical protein ABIF19_05230, partial [Planctomycetota bacterium]
MFRKSMCLVSFVLAIAAMQTAIGNGAPGNDDCQNAESVGNVTDLAFDTTLATFDGPGLYMTSPNIWYCYTATCTGGATVSLAGSSFDTKLAVYDGCACDPAENDFIKGNDDFHLQQSEMTFPVTAGEQYLIEVGGFSAGATGQGVMNITCSIQSGAPSNDNCSGAEQVYDVNDLPFDTTSATMDGPGLCVNSPNVWYSYSAFVTGDVTVSVFGLGNFDAKLAVYNGTYCNPTEDDLIDCNDDFGNSYDPELTFKAVAGHDYLIEVGGYNEDATGRGLLTIDSGAAPPPFSNDKCQNARPVGNVTNLAFDTQDATFDGPGHCMNSPNIWFRYTAPCTGQATVSLCGSSFDTMLAIYDGSECYPKQSDMIGCNDDACDMQSELTIDVVAGQQYLIEVGSYGSETGKGVLTISCDGPVAAGKSDLGDAPDSTNNFGTTMTAYASPSSVSANYPTVFDDGSGFGPYGPVHVNTQTVAYLGKTITRETEADTGPDDDGTNNVRPLIDSPNRDDGDDGVVFPVTLPNCDWTTFDYTVTVAKPGTDLWVNVWLDFNRDGDWDDTLTCPAGSAPEWAVQNQLLFGLPAGLNQLTTPAFRSWHPKSGPEEIWMR